MAAAVDVVQAAGMPVDGDDKPAAHLRTSVALASLQPGSREPSSPRLWRRHLPRLIEAAAGCGGPVTDVDQVGDPVGAVDALVAGVDPGLSSPGVENRDVVLVTGPWLAGATGVIAALRDRLPEQEFVETEDIRPAEAPAVVVFVVSAAAPITESDCALMDSSAAHRPVIGVVSKIDVHRNWEDVLRRGPGPASGPRGSLTAMWCGSGLPRRPPIRRTPGRRPRRPRYLRLDDKDLEAAKQAAGVGISRLRISPAGTIATPMVWAGGRG